MRLAIRIVVFVVAVAAAAALGSRLARPSFDAVRPIPAGDLGHGPRGWIEPYVLAVDRHRKSPAAHGELGLAYEAIERWPEALIVYRHAAVLAPGERQWSYRVAIALAHLGRRGQAIRILADLTATDPSFAPAWHRLGQLRLDAGDLVGAAVAFERAANAAPDRAEGSIGLARVALRRQRPDTARGHLEDALALDPARPFAHYLFGRAQRMAGRDHDAAAELDRGAGSTPMPMPDVMTPRIAELRRAAGSAL